MRLLLSLLVLAVLSGAKYARVVVLAEDNDTIWKGFSVTCTNEEKGELANVSVSCHGIRLVRKIVQRLLEEAKRKRSLEILDGVSLVEKEETKMDSRSGRGLTEFGAMGSVVNFLGSRELKIKLPSLLPVNFESAIQESLPSADQARHRGGGFGGGKKGDSGVMLMALMMGKTMAAMGFGALALLAMKALMVSALALMLSLIVAAKKLAGSKDDDGHHVVYAQEVSSHHRRKRRSSSPDNDLDLIRNQPYRGYMAELPTKTRRR